MKKTRGRTRKTIDETIKKDLEVNYLTKDILHDMQLWRQVIYVADPT